MRSALRIFYYLCNRYTSFKQCRNGGIGRHEGLKIPWPQGCAGSSPARGTSLFTGLTLWLFSLLIISCGGKSGYFTLEGRFLHINQGELYIYSPDGGITGMDTIRIEAGRFAYQTPMDKASTLIMVFPNFSQHPIFAVPGGSVDIKADASNLKEMTIKGTDDNDLMTEFRGLIINKSPIEEKKHAEEFIKDNPESRVSLYLFQKYFVNVPKIDFSKALNLLSVMEKAKKSDIQPMDLARLKQHINGIKTTAEGSKLPSFTVQDMDGKTISSSDMSKGIAVISTWATWSYASLEIQRTLRDLNKDNSELKLLCICLDGSKKEAEQTIERQSLEGSIVCDELMTEGKLYRQLGFNTVPDNIVLNNGKIIERGLDNKELKNKLKRLLKTKD